MNEILTKLGNWGCDVQGAMKRMCDDEEFYIECLHDIVEDPNFDALKVKLDTGDIRGAFEATHTLKGVLSNIGLTPMYNKVVEIVEPLRSGSKEDLSEQYKQLIEMKNYLTDIISSR